MSEYSFVYVMLAESGLVKIGQSVRPKIRKSEIICPLGSKIYNVYCARKFHMDRIDAAEHAVQQLLLDKHSCGEWFNCSPFEAQYTLEHVTDEEMHQFSSTIALRHKRRPKVKEKASEQLLLRVSSECKTKAQLAADKADRKLASWVQWLIRRELGLIGK